MTAGELIEDVLIGSGFVAVITSYHCFRIFSFAGTQRMVVSFPGIICICELDEHVVGV